MVKRAASLHVDVGAVEVEVLEAIDAFKNRAFVDVLVV